MLAAFRELPVDRTVAERAGRIRRESGIRLPDALIAATALEHRLGLATRHRADFDRVRGLRIRNLG
jgi:toxin FitB